MEVIGLFPTPVLITSLNRDFTKKELKEFNTIKENVIQRHHGSLRSIDTNVLNNPTLSNLKQEITGVFDMYMNEVIKVNNEVTSEISLSWINWQEKNQETHIHRHQNSYLSAVLYIEAYEKDNIQFFNERYKQIELESREYDINNCDTYWFDVKIGDIIVFPSYLSHGVKARESDKGVRTSLAVNMFPTGKFGSKEKLTELII